MKKFLAIIMASLLVFSLAACGNEATEETTPETVAETTVEAIEETQISNSTEKAPVITYVESALGGELSNYQISELSSSILYSCPDKESDVAFDITFDGVNVKKGTALKELISAGYVLTEDVKVPGNGEEFVSLKNEDKNVWLYITVYNDAKTKKSANDCSIKDINVGDASPDSNAMSYFDYKGIKMGSTLEDVFATIGTPKSISIMSSGAYSSANNAYYDRIVLSYSSPVNNDESSTLEIDLLFDNGITFAFYAEFDTYEF